MTKTLRNRLTLLGTTSLFAVALVASPISFNSITLTPELGVAYAGGHGGHAQGDGGQEGKGGSGGNSNGSGGGSSDGGGSGGNGTSDGATS